LPSEIADEPREAAIGAVIQATTSTPKASERWATPGGGAVSESARWLNRVWGRFRVQISFAAGSAGPFWL